MTLIMRGRRYGFALEDLRQWLLIYEQHGTKPQMKTFVEMADRQMIELQRQREELAQVIADLKAMRDLAESLSAEADD